MLGTRTPYRISFVGGGSDLREFYSEYPGCVVSAAINKYMYIFVHPCFDQKIQVKYSRTELADRIEDIQHPIVREVLKKFNLTGIDINSIGDIPSGTGLGSSSSFTVGLLHSLYAYMSKYTSKETLADEACKIEIEILKEPIGKQDQYAVSYGGLNFITFNPDETVSVEPLIVPKETFTSLENNLLMFYIGKARLAHDILHDQKRNLLSQRDKFATIREMTGLAAQFKDCLLSGSLQDVGRIMNENWKLKKCLSEKISDASIDSYYDIALKNGASGGKLLGAGGGGFLLFYCEQENQQKLRRALKDIREISFKFDHSGSKVIYFSEHYNER